MLRVTMLGCGPSGGVPQIGGADGHGHWGACDPAEPRNRRTRSSIVIEGPDGQRLLVDTGPDLRAQLLATGIGRVDAILFTHHHADHIMGVDEVRILNRQLGREIQAFGMARTLESLQHRFDYAFLPSTAPMFFRPALVPVTVAPGDRFQAAGMAVEVLLQDHHVMDTLAVRVGDFAYSTDLVRMPEETFDRLHGLDTWVVACFQRPSHPVHANLEEVLAWVERLRPRRTVLTHMGHGMDYGWLRQNLPPRVEPGYDGLVLEAPGRG